MNKQVALLYLFWCIALVVIGIRMYGIVNSDRPGSMKSNFQEIEKVMNEDR